MNEPISEEDQQWLDALAGAQGTNSILNEHAHVVRQVLQKRRLDIEADASKDRGTELDQLRVRLRQEGLLLSEAKNEPTLLHKLIALLNIGSASQTVSSGTGRSMIRIVPLGLLLALVVGVFWMVAQVRAPQFDERLIYRGDPNVSVLLVVEPEQRAKVLESELRSLPALVSIQPLKPNGWLLKVQESDDVRDYLSSQRIEGVAVNGLIVLLVLPAEDSKP